MSADLGFSNARAGALATADLAGYACMSLLGGALASRYGPRRVITVGLSLCALGMLGTGLARGFGLAAVTRLVTGLGSGLSNVPIMGLLSAWFGVRRRGFAAGVVVTGSSFALIILGTAVPFLLSRGGEDAWRTVWFVYGGTALGLALISYLLLRDRPAEMGLEPLGQVRPAHPDQTAAPPLLKGGPVKSAWTAVYRAPTVWHLGLVYSCFGFSYVVYMTFFVAHLESMGFDRAEAGRLLTILGWAALFCGVLWGTISDVIGRKWGLMLVYLIQTAAYALFGLSTAGSSGFVVSAVLFGLTAWSIPAIVAATCGDVLGARLAPAALGFLTLFFAVGQLLGPATAGVIADAGSGFAPAFLVASGVALLGALGAALLRPASTTAAEWEPAAEG
jgi:sugar phosphate permease